MGSPRHAMNTPPRVFPLHACSAILETRNTTLPASKGNIMNNEDITDRSTEKPASLADVAKLHRQKRLASAVFARADQDYDEALRSFEQAILIKDIARQRLAAAVTAYEEAKAEAES